MVCSPETARLVDEEVVSIVKQQYAKAMQILKDNAAKLNEIAAYLLERETITGEEFMEILNAGKENAEECAEAPKPEEMQAAESGQENGAAAENQETAEQNS